MIVSQVINKLEQLLPQKKINIFGKDSLMKSSIPYYFLAFLSLIGTIQENADPFLFIAIVYAGLPLIDEIFSLDVRNPDQKERKELQQQDAYFRAAIYAAIVLDWIVFFRIMSNFSKSEITIFNSWVYLGVIFISSNLSSAQFAVAHEVMHKPGIFYKILGTAHMSKLYYMHFTFHHLYRHHYQVATPNDPSTSRKGENVYSFIVRCIKYSFIGVYNDQKKLGKSFFQNYAVLSILANIVFTMLIYWIFGLQSTIIHLMIAFGAIFYLEAINYIEHYGLERKKLANGEFEKVTIMHSWNAPHRFTNYLFFKLQRHSDHHENSMKPYQTLTSLDKSPFLPHGYTLMIFMSFFPKTWFRIIDPLVDEYKRITDDPKLLIDESVKQKALTQTRKFMIELGLSVTLIWIFSMIRFI